MLEASLACALDNKAYLRQIVKVVLYSLLACSTPNSGPSEVQSPNALCKDIWPRLVGLSRNYSAIYELIEKKVVYSFSTCGDTSISALISIFIVEEATRLGKLSFPINKDYRWNVKQH